MNQVMRRSLSLATVALVGGLRLLRAAVGVLAHGAQTTPSNDELSSMVRGGLLNFRTGKCDEGTDPAGIYNTD